NVISKDCRTGQKLRVNIQGDKICCITVKCEKSQQFRYCHIDGESDICKNCTNNSYTNDPIDTSQWPYHDEEQYQSEPDVCVSPPSCEADGVVLVGRECVCNLNGGYWGTDQHNCQLDKKNCRRAGVQLTLEDDYRMVNVILIHAKTEIYHKSHVGKCTGSIKSPKKKQKKS
ncbi:Hypothetical predicted protein, partial [Mytilus galloprovincialis]